MARYAVLQKEPQVVKAEKSGERIDKEARLRSNIVAYVYTGIKLKILTTQFFL